VNPKILFINPPLTIMERYGLKYQSGGQTPPLGLTNLAASLRERGFDVKILDGAALSLSCEEVAQLTIKKNPDFVGLTAVTSSIGNTSKVASLIKEHLNKVKIIIGGPHFTAIPEKTLQLYPQFDIGCFGESDYTISELISSLTAGKDLRQVKGLFLRENGNLLFTGLRERVRDLDNLPFPAWDLLPNLAKYYCPPVHTLKKIPASMLVTSRGCPGQCIFCDRSMFGNNVSFYSASYVMAMIKNLYQNYGIREIQFRDDNFVAIKKRLMELCNLLITEKLDIVWTCMGRADMINPEMLNMMKRAGCWQIWYGIESGSQKVLDVINKKITLEEIKKAVLETEKAGIEPCATFIIGHPTETEDSINATIKFSLSLPLKEAHFSFMTPFPGSLLYEKAGEFGTFNNDWKMLSGWFPVFVPKELTEDKLVFFNKQAFRKFYFRPRIVLSYLKKIKTLTHLRIYLNGFLALLEFLIKGRESNRM